MEANLSIGGSMALNRWAGFSKEATWTRGRIEKYPTIKEVNQAILDKDAVQIIRWNRYLRSPETEDERKTIERIVKGMNILQRYYDGRM